MTIKVIGAGFGRTGTLSLKHALERLGFEKAHHMLEVAKSREQIDHWTAIAKGDPVDWDRVFDGFQSTTDFPACVYYKELCTTYPDAKVILSVRDEDRWHTSVINTILPVSRSVPSWLLFLLRPQNGCSRLSIPLFGKTPSTAKPLIQTTQSRSSASIIRR